MVYLFNSIKLPLPQCSTCLDPLSRLHACLHCIYIGCWKKGHMKDHQQEKKHTFGKIISCKND